MKTYGDETKLVYTGTEESKVPQNDTNDDQSTEGSSVEEPEYPQPSDEATCTYDAQMKQMLEQELVKEGRRAIHRYHADLRLPGNNPHRGKGWSFDRFPWSWSDAERPKTHQAMRYEHESPP